MEGIFEVEEGRWLLLGEEEACGLGVSGFGGWWGWMIRVMEFCTLREKSCRSVFCLRMRGIWFLLGWWRIMVK